MPPTTTQQHRMQVRLAHPLLLLHDRLSQFPRRKRPSISSQLLQRFYQDCSVRSRPRRESEAFPAGRHHHFVASAARAAAEVRQSVAGEAAVEDDEGVGASLLTQGTFCLRPICPVTILSCFVVVLF